MLEGLERIREDRLEKERALPEVSPASIREETVPGKDIRGKLEIRSGDGHRIRGMATVTNARIVLDRERFSGREISIAYGVDAEGLREGSTVKGEIVLLINTGEVHIPVQVTVVPDMPQSGREKIDSPEKLLYLAKNERAEALRFLKDPHFGRSALPDGASYAAWKALTQNPVTYQRLEEFLVGLGLKEAVRFTADKDHDSFLHLTDSSQGTLTVTKNTWGNVNLNVSAAGSFISLPQRHFVEDDFVGNTLVIRYIIDYDAIGDGMVHGRILCESDTDTLTLDITASRHTAERAGEMLAWRKAVVSAWRSVLDVRQSRIDTGTFVRRAVPAISALQRYGGDRTEYHLYAAYAYLLAGARDAAAKILRTVPEERLSEESAECEAMWYYLSAAAGVIAEDQDKLLTRIRRLRDEDETSPVILLLLGKLDAELAKRPGKMLSLIAAQYRQGVSHPLLFLKAANLFAGDPAYLTGLTPFTRAILHFAERQGVMTEDLALRTALLAANEKGFSTSVYILLERAYKRFPLDEILEAILRLILKGNPRKAHYFPWYEKAIQRDLRITRLYEYYMETIPEGRREVLPLKVRRYFTMNSALGAPRRAMLYANITRNRAVDPETYASYREIIRNFVMEVLQSGNVNTDTAYLIQTHLTDLPNREAADAMARILFRCSIVCDDPRAREVVVVHPYLDKEAVCPLSGGIAYADLYTGDAAVYIQDERGRRFRSGVVMAIRHLFDESAYLAQLHDFGVSETGYLLHTLDKDRFTVRSSHLAEFIEASSDASVSEETLRRINAALLEYFAANPEDQDLDLYLARLDLTAAAGANHALLTDIFLMKDRMREAFSLCCSHGYEDIDPKQLAFLTGRIIALRDYLPDDELLLMAMEALRRGAANQEILRYLVSHFAGAMDDMVRVRQEAAAQAIDTQKIDERILTLAVFVGSTPKDPRIFRDYANAGGDRELIGAYIALVSAETVRGGALPDEELVSYMGSVYDEGRADDLMTIALLRYYAEKPAAGEREAARRSALFETCMRSGWLYPFMSALPRELLAPYQLDDKMILACRAPGAEKVTLSWRGAPDSELLSEAIPSRMPGSWYVRALTMFAGEVVRYAFEITKGGTVSRTEETAKIMPTPDVGGRSEYLRINRMILSVRQGNTEGFRENWKKYAQAKKAAKDLFPLIAEETDGQKA